MNVGRIEHAPDYGKTQTSLFDSPAVCPSCLTTRRSLCRWAADRAAGGTYEKRPKGCLVSAQLGADEELPF